MSLLKQIQEDLLNDTVKTSTILRKAYILARKLGDPDFLNWVHNELNGYDWNKIKNIKDFPEYRRPGGYLQGIGPFNITKPVEIYDPEIHEKVCRPPIVMSIPEIEAQIEETTSRNSIHMTVAPQTSVILCKAIGMQLNLFLAYSKASFQGIVDAVRNKLLEIILDIKEKTPDIEEKELTESEKKELSKNIIQIINNPQGCQIAVEQSTTYNFEEFKGIVASTLIKKGISKDNIDRLKNVLDEANKESSPGKVKKLPAKILDFIKKNKDWLTTTAIEIIKKFWLST